MTFQSDRLFEIFSSSRFLNLEGLSGEVPIFIQSYSAADEDRVTIMIRALASRLRTSGIPVAEVDLFELLLAELEEEDILHDLIAEESSFDRNELFDTLKNHADASSRIVPRLVRIMGDDQPKLTLVSGAGHVYPFLRTHTLLDSIQPVMMDHPVILFFPGEYNQVKGLGSQLRLFGTLLSKGYYRAFNLDQYRLPQS